MIGDVLLQADGVRMILRGMAPEFLEKVFHEWLEGRGWIVQRPRDWEKPNAFCRRLGISGKTLHKKLKERNCPRLGLDRGEHGRLRALAATAAFEEFCTREKITL